MVNKIKLSRMKHSSSSILISVPLAETLGVEKATKINLIYGNNIEEVRLAKTGADGLLGLSPDLVEKMLIVEELEYEVRAKSPTMQIGPFIGILLGNHRKQLLDALPALDNYTVGYNSINGLVYAFALEDVDTERKVIAGYYFQPSKGWVEGLFAYPSVIYRRSNLPLETYSHLLKELGPKIFNSYFFDKWETWNWLREFKELQVHLPETRLLSRQNFEEMLLAYNRVFLKPVDGSMALGLIRVTLQEGMITFRTLRPAQTFECRLGEEWPEEIKGLVTNRYLVQKAIPLVTYEDRNVDFRLIMQKNAAQKWDCTGIIGRFGKKGEIASNFRNGGFALRGESAIRKIWKVSELEVFRFKQQLISFGIRVCKCIEACGGLYADMGLDIGVDAEKNFWLIEVNKRHDHALALDVRDPYMYYQVKYMPIAYAKSLSWQL